ncbi:MAG TPA: SDR family oxidoreductase [Polyangiaceae bacterium]|nr:SDR family oxidoreductase [Polyangiaceae bacterium]
MKLAVVTGASRGIGRATALELAHRGLGLALVGRASPAQDETVELARRRGSPSVRAFACDLADAVATERIGSELAALGPPDVLVHNAGVAPRVAVEATATAVWEETLLVNLTAPFLLTRALVPAMRREGKGRIVFVGSISSTLGTARQAAYVASKWGLVGFMKSLAEELKDTGVVTLAVLPGSTATRMLEGSGFEPRMSAEDVAKTIVHFALDAPAAHAGGVVEMFGV